MSDDVLDLKEFLERVQDDNELLLELFDIFIEDYKGKRKSLQTAILQKEYEQVRGIAHSLKGASGNISAKELRLVFSTLEDMGKKNDINGAEAVLVDLDRKYNSLLKRIDEVRKELRK
jgi:HPt (histidine-containing phosphotransfer) domain-containing protein